MKTMWRTYVPMRREFYAAEARWRDAPFWARRAGTELT
jgi:hypothetical protein